MCTARVISVPPTSGRKWQSAERLSRTSAPCAVRQSCANIGPPMLWGRQMRAMRKLIVSAILASSPVVARAAASCDQFKAAMVEGAAKHQAPPPNFQLEQVNSAAANVQYFTISMFDDVRAMMSCVGGEVDTFEAEANSADQTSIVHTMLLAATGLHGYGLAWRPAFKMRDQLFRLAKASDKQAANVHLAGGEASLVISPAGAPNFRIDTNH